MLFETKPSLSTEQQKAHDEIMDYVFENPNGYSMMLLEGYAGTGKTFTISNTIESILTRNSSMRIAVTAPTHKAVRVLRKFSPFRYKTVFATIHSLLGLKEQINERTGKVEYVESKDPENPPRIHEMALLIVDESSMLADELFELLIPYLRKGLKIVFIGDPVQIPPIGKADSIPFSEAQRKKYNIHRVVLEKVMRQAGDNPILEYATRIRKVYKTAYRIPVDHHVVEDHGIYSFAQSDESGIKAVLQEYFDCDQFRQDADHMKIVAWRNVTVDGFNDYVRRLLYKQDILPRLMPEEKMIMDKPLLNGNKVVVSANQELEVVQYDLVQYELSYQALDPDGFGLLERRTEEFKCYYATIAYFDAMDMRVQRKIHILHEDEDTRFKKLVDSMMKVAKDTPSGNPLRGKLWHAYFAVQKEFAQVKYNYAITGHKSQGSTYNNCMVVLWDILHNRNIEERNRIQYVAATRPRHKLFVIQ